MKSKILDLRSRNGGDMNWRAASAEALRSDRSGADEIFRADGMPRLMVKHGLADRHLYRSPEGAAKVRHIHGHLAE